jgi:hypothetical protein
LFFGRESVPNAGTRPAEKLPGYGPIGTLNPARKNIIGQSFEAVAEPGQFGSRAAPAPTLPTLGGTTTAGVGLVRVVP